MRTCEESERCLKFITVTTNVKLWCLCVSCHMNTSKKLKSDFRSNTLHRAASLVGVSVWMNAGTSVNTQFSSSKYALWPLTRSSVLAQPSSSTVKQRRAASRQLKDHRDTEGDVAMTTEYRDEAEEDSSSFWNKGRCLSESEWLQCEDECY